MNTDQPRRGAGARCAHHRLRLLLLAVAGAAAVLTSGAGSRAVAGQPSWIFDRGTYTHDPCTGARVAQFARVPPVEALADQRLITSRYLYSRTNLRGLDGSLDTYYEVQAWGNNGYGLGAEWERFHDAWKESYIQGGYNTYRPNGPPFYGGFPAYPSFNYGAPAYGFPGYGYGWPQQ